MKKLPLRSRKALLWLITTAVPVVVAACYGVMYAFSKSGKVVDKHTGEGIYGLQVSCVVSNRNDVEDSTYTYEDGGFVLGFDRECNMIVIEDVDGEENGGYYGDRVINYNDFNETDPIEMERRSD
jgi:hypothetical protein